MSMTLDAVPDAPPPLADYAQVPIGTTQAPPPLPLPTAPAAPAVSPLGAQPDLGQMSAELANIQRQKIAANEPQYAAIQATMARDKERLTKAYDAAGIGPDDLPQWNADEARDKFQYDPIQAFGSIGSVFAMVASAFTNRPMENAMLGAAAAMNAQKAGNEQEYERAYKAWQDNTKLAINRQKIQNDQYQNAISLFNTDMAAGQALLKINALKFGDKQALFLLENGMDDKLIDLATKRQDMMFKLEKTMPEIETGRLKNADLKARTAGLAPGSQEFSNAIIEHTRDWSESNVTAAQRYISAAAKEYDANTDGAYSDYINAKWDKFSEDTKADTTRKMSEPQKAFKEEIKTKFDREPTSQEWADFNRQYNDKGPRKMDPVKQAYVDETTAKTGQAPTSEELVNWEKNRKTAMTNVERKLSPEDAKFLAQQALRGDNSVFTNLGRGAQGAENVIMVRKAIREEAEAKGMSGADVALKNAEYQGLKAAERVAGSREAIISIAANEAINMMATAEQAAAAVPRTRWVPINKLSQYINKQASDPELAAFAQANESLVNGYVRAISPTGVPTDLVRKHAYNALTTAQGPEAYAAVIRIMRQEMDNALRAPEQVKQQLMAREKRERAGEYMPLTSATGAAPGAVAPPPTVGGVIRYDANGNRIQ